MWLYLEIGVFKEVIQIEWDHKGGALTQQDWCPYKTLQVCREKVMWGHNEKLVIGKQGRQTSPDMEFSSTLILDL